jgi:hypothetical protein
MNLRPVGSNQTELQFGSGTVVFFSYETPVAALVPMIGARGGKKLMLTNRFYSVTTSRHISQWTIDKTDYDWQSVDPEEIEKLIPPGDQ